MSEVTLRILSPRHPRRGPVRTHIPYRPETLPEIEPKATNGSNSHPKAGLSLPMSFPLPTAYLVHTKPPLDLPDSPLSWEGVLQGYLAHKKPPPPPRTTIGP